MAKVGEGDPRWLVENREDGKNVNNWHWSEKNLNSWVSGQLSTALSNKLICDNEKFKFLTTNVEALKGNVMMNTRKGKNSFIWDVGITVNWVLYFYNDGDQQKFVGKLSCQDITSVDDIYYTTITCDECHDISKIRPVQSTLKDIGGTFVGRIWNEVVDQMKSFFIESPIAAPTKTVNNTRSSVESAVTSKGQKINVRSIQQRFRFSVPPHVLFETLLDQKKIYAFTGSPADISDKVGTEFKIFGGNISGVLKSVQAPNKIVQTWRFSSWPIDHFSLVSFSLTPVGSHSCQIVVDQKNIPENDFERTSVGWEQNYWYRIRAAFGWEYETLKGSGSENDS